VAQESPGHAAAQGEVGTHLSPAAYCQLERLRERLCLTNEDLAAMGCSESQARAVLNTLVSWFEQNKSQLRAAQADQIATEDQIRSVRKLVRIGLVDRQTLANFGSLSSTYAQQLQQESDLLDKAIEGLSGKLSDSQNSIWKAARDNTGLPGPYRYVAQLDARQAAAIRQAHLDLGRRLAVARSASARQAAREAFTNAVEHCLSAYQLSVGRTAQTNVTRCMEGVLRASQQVLPTPSVMQGL